MFVNILDIDECKLNPCVFGNCTDLLNKFSCSCNYGFDGILCENIGNTGCFFYYLHLAFVIRKRFFLGKIKNQMLDNNAKFSKHWVRLLLI